MLLQSADSQNGRWPWKPVEGVWFQREGQNELAPTLALYGSWVVAGGDYSITHERVSRRLLP
jgi:hypothetical protein